MLQRAMAAVGTYEYSRNQMRSGVTPSPIEDTSHIEPASTHFHRLSGSTRCIVQREILLACNSTIVQASSSSLPGFRNASSLQVCSIGAQHSGRAIERLCSRGSRGDQGGAQGQIGQRTFSGPSWPPGSERQTVASETTATGPPLVGSSRRMRASTGMANNIDDELSLMQGRLHNILREGYSFPAILPSYTGVMLHPNRR